MSVTVFYTLGTLDFPHHCYNNNSILRCVRPLVSWNISFVDSVWSIVRLVCYWSRPDIRKAALLISSLSPRLLRYLKIALDAQSCNLVIKQSGSGRSSGDSDPSDIKIISEKSWEDSDANVRLHSKYVPSSYETQAATRCAFYALATLVCQRPFVTF